MTLARIAEAQHLAIAMLIAANVLLSLVLVLLVLVLTRRVRRIELIAGASFHPGAALRERAPRWPATTWLDAHPDDLDDQQKRRPA